MPTNIEPQINTAIAAGAQPDDIMNLMKTREQRDTAQRIISSINDVNKTQIVSTMDDIAVPTAKLHPKEINDTAFYTAALTDSQEGFNGKVKTYYDVKEQLETNGNSYLVNNLLASINNDQADIRSQAVLQTLYDDTIPSATKEAVVRGYLLEKNREMKLDEAYTQQVAATTNATTKTELNQEEVDFDFLNKRSEIQQKIQTMAAKAALSREEKTIQEMKDAGSIYGPQETERAFLGLLASIAPVWDAATFQKAKQQALGKDDPWYIDIWNTLNFGSNRKELNRVFLAAPNDKKVEIAQKFIEAMDSLPNTNFQRYQQILTNIENPEIADWEVVLDNITGWLDLIVVGSISRSAAKIVKGTDAASPMGRTTIASQEEGGKLAATVLKDETGEVANAAGTTKQEVMADVLPKHTDEILTDAPAGVIEKLDEIDNIARDIVTQTETSGINYTELEKATARKSVDDLVANVQGMTLKVPQSVVLNDGERYTVKAMYGTEKGGFKTIKDAQERFNEIFGASTEKVVPTFFKRNPETGEWIQATEQELTKGRGKFGQWYAQATFDHVYNPYDKGVFGIDVVSKAGGGIKGGYLFDASARFDRQMSQAMIRAEQVGTVTEQRLLRLVDKNIRKLPTDSQRKILQTIDEGSKEERTYTSGELQAKGFSIGEMVGYYTYRKVQDVNWTLANRSYKKQLDSEGVSRILVKGEEEARYGRVFDSAEEALREYDARAAYNPSLGIQELNAADVAHLYNAGGKIARLRKSHKDGENVLDYIVLPTETTTVTRIPESPLPYIDGYVHRGYKTYWFIDRIPKKIVHNGRVLAADEIAKNSFRYAETIGTAENRGTLEQRLTEEALDDNYTYVVRPGREYGEDVEREFSAYTRGLRQLKGRGNHLTSSGDELAATEDVISSLLHSVRTVARQTGYSDFIVGAKRSFVKSYSSILKEPGKFPADVKDIVKRGDTREYNNAVALWQQINFLQNPASKFDSGYQKFMFDLSNAVAGLSTDGVRTAGTSVLRKASDIRPISLTKSIPSMLFIRLRPLRQLLLQSGQLAQLSFLDPKYVTTRMPREIAALSTLSILRDSRYMKAAGVSKESIYKAAAKTWGVSVDEMKKIDREFFDLSGLPGSIDKNALVEAGARIENYHAFDSTIKRIYRSPVDAVKFLTDLTKKVGFDAGEFINLSGSWGFARTKYLKDNPGANLSDKVHADRVAALAQEIAYSMTKPGQFQYQKGVVSIPLQFMAVPHKAILSMLPEKLGGSRIWSTADKAKIAAANLTLFGSYGIGAYSAMDYLREQSGVMVPDDLWLGIKGGLVDWSFNKLLDNMLDESAGDIKFSESFSPVQDRIIPIIDILQNFEDKNFVTAFLGPTGAVIGSESRVFRAMRDVETIFGVMDVSTPEKFKLSAMATLNVASGYNDWLKFRVADNMNKIVSSRGGDTGLEATSKEAIAKLFGFQTYQEADLYKLQKDRYGSPSIQGDGDGYYTELQTAAKQWYDSVSRIVTLYQNDPDKMNAQLMGHKALLTFLDDEERNLILSYVQQLDKQVYNTTRDSIINRLFRDVITGPNMANDIGNKVMNNTAIPPEEKRKLLDLINLMIGEEIY